MNPFRPIHGVLKYGDLTNDELIADVAAAAMVAADCIRGGMPRASAARTVWRFVKFGTWYKEEGPEGQFVRMPWRFLSDGGGDCKSQAVFIAAMCAASGCRVVLRFVTLPGDTQPGHVFAVVDGQPVDPLLDFGKECAYIRAVDIPIR